MKKKQSGRQPGADPCRSTRLPLINAFFAAGFVAPIPLLTIVVFMCASSTDSHGFVSARALCVASYTIPIAFIALGLIIGGVVQRARHRKAMGLSSRLGLQLLWIPANIFWVWVLMVVVMNLLA